MAYKNGIILENIRKLGKITKKWNIVQKIA